MYFNYSTVLKKFNLDLIVISKTIYYSQLLKFTNMRIFKKFALFSDVFLFNMIIFLEKNLKLLLFFYLQKRRLVLECPWRTSSSERTWMLNLNARSRVTHIPLLNGEFIFKYLYFNNILKFFLFILGQRITSLVVFL